MTGCVNEEVIFVQKRVSGIGGEEAECKEVNMRQNVIYPFKKVYCRKNVGHKLSGWGRERVLLSQVV